MLDLEKTYETRLETVAQQIDILKVRFGDKHFDEAFIIQLRKEWKNLSEEGIKDCVAYLVGNRPAHKPPLIPDFTRARVEYEARKFKENMASAEDLISSKPSPDHPSDADKKFLEQTGAKSMWEAVQQRLKEKSENEGA